MLHPTAIDELRTASAERRIGLTDRWPLQENDTERLIYFPPDNAVDAPEYAELLGGHDFEAEGTREQAVAIFRGFELGVFHDIATRDHLLVSSTDGLVLYRPVVVNGEDSSGARAEVAHWLQRWVSEPPESAPRLVAMHTFQDVDLRLERLHRDERMELLGRMKECLQAQGFDRDQARSLVEGRTPTSTHLQQLYKSAEELEQELEYAAGVALVHCFLNWLCNVRPSEGRTGAAFVTAESAEQLRSPEKVEVVTRLLSGEEDSISTTATYLAEYAQAKSHNTLTAFAQSLISEQDF